MSLLKDLKLLGKGYFNEMFLHKSGEIEPNDFRAINGDTIAKSKIVSSFREFVISTEAVADWGNPIVIDDVIKGTRKIVIRLLSCNSNKDKAFCPNIIPFYDPTGWLKNRTSEESLDIFIVSPICSRSASTGAIANNINYSTSISIYYCSSSTRIMEKTNYTSLKTTGFSRASTAAMLHLSLGTSLTSTALISMSDIISNGFLKYL